MGTNPPSDHQATLLVVEDDESIRDAVTRLFVREGYLVLTAATGHDAMGLLRTPATAVDVVLLDIGLPDVSGADLCARMRQFFPNLPVVVCTGAASTEEIDELRRHRIARLLTKPVAFLELVEAVNSACKVPLEPRAAP
jgi:two-component system catabolic regulation response regulator CreB